jgi:hypothetical protein
VKPCPGDKRNAQGFSGSPGDGTTSKQEYKGYKNRLQVDVLYGPIEKIYVTLIALFQQVSTLELGILFQ